MELSMIRILGVFYYPFLFSGCGASSLFFRIPTTSTLSFISFFCWVWMMCFLLALRVTDRSMDGWMDGWTDGWMDQ